MPVFHKGHWSYLASLGNKNNISHSFYFHILVLESWWFEKYITQFSSWLISLWQNMRKHFKHMKCFVLLFDVCAMAINIVQRTSGVLGGSIVILLFHHPDKSVDYILLLLYLYQSPIGHKTWPRTSLAVSNVTYISLFCCTELLIIIYSN